MPSPAHQVRLPLEERGLAGVRALHRAIIKSSVSDEDDGAVEYRLDLQDAVSKNGHTRVDAKWGALACNIMLSDEFRGASVELAAPARGPEVTQLARSGLLYALARHKKIHLTGNDSDFSAKLGQWRYDWVPVQSRNTLFSIPSEIDGRDPVSVDDKVVAFLNPAPSRIEVDARRKAIYPWLRELCGSMGIKESDARGEILTEISSIATELLDNVQDHASANDSMLTISRINSGASTVVQLVVVDNGIGIPASIQQRDDTEDPLIYLESVLNGGAELRARGRGDGLARISRIVRSFSGEILLASGPMEDGKGTLLVDHAYTGSDAISVTDSDDLGVGGTVVVVRLPLRRYIEQDKLIGSEKGRDNFVGEG